MHTLHVAMFEGSDEVGREQPDDGSSSEEEPGLGFFQPAESDDSETEVIRRSKFENTKYHDYQNQTPHTFLYAL